MKAKEQIFSKIEAGSPLPSLPHVLIKLIDVCDDDNIPIGAIAPVVSKDSSLSSKVLQLVNSAYFGLNRTFSSLEQAVVYLGASTIKNLAITASIQQVFKGLKKQESFRIGHFWYQSLFCATLARSLAESTNYASKEEAYLAGLLHNIGQLILLVNFPKQYLHIQETYPDIESTCQQEEKNIGITHCEAGSWLLRHWKISPFIADAALYHHSDVEYIQDGFPLVKLTYLAATLSLLQEESLLSVAPLAKNLFDIDQDTLTTIYGSAKEDVLDIAQSLEIEIEIKVPEPPESEPKNGKQQPFSPNSDKFLPISEDFTTQDKELFQQTRNDSLLISFLRNLVGANSKDPILAATEEIIRLLLPCDTLFFLLFDENNILQSTTSTNNKDGELVKDLSLQLNNQSSLLLTCLTNSTILEVSQTSVLETGNLADNQLLGIINCPLMYYVPLVAKSTKIGVMVLGYSSQPHAQTDSHLKQLNLIAGQTAIALHLLNLQHRENQKLQAERMATAALAARKIVHEVNNPLGIISNYLKLLEIKIPDDLGVDKDLQILDEEINRISKIIGELSDFTSPSLHQEETIRVTEQVSKLLKILQPSLLTPSKIEVQVIADPHLKEIVTDKDKLQQILINLLKNSAEAMTEGGVIIITLKNKNENNTTNGIKITISDNGPGIPVRIQEKIFSPFMTTKEQGHSGLGLSIVHKSVEELNGTIAYRSSRDTGTRFTICLPLHISNYDKEYRG